MYLLEKEITVLNVERKEDKTMEKEFKIYRLCWIASIFFYSFVVFKLRFSLDRFGLNIITGSFVLAILGLIMQAAVMDSAYKNGKLNAVFYRLPVIKVGMLGLVVMILITALIGLVPDFPLWLASIACLIVTFGILIAINRVEKRAETIESIDEKIEDQTEFIRSMTIAAESLMNSVHSEKIKKVCKKVYEGFRYSDPMSTELSMDEEEKIREQFSKFILAVKNEDKGQVDEISEKILQTLEKRNKRLRYTK